MDKQQENLTSWLFKTGAVKICPENKPFWYTSGKIGPYYINTHFLYGSQEKANQLLQIIDKEKYNVETCSYIILKNTIDNYDNDPIYKGLIDSMCLNIKKRINLNDVNYISGGERRDWFFSLIISKMLDKPHLTIFKDQTIVLSDGLTVKKEFDLQGRDVLHIADLITEASSYIKLWIPAVNEKGARIKWSYVVVDRLQGGREVLGREEIDSHSMMEIGRNLFVTALSMGIITKGQYDMILEYIDNPNESMKIFLEKHPEFLENSLNGDPKTIERARLCISNNVYN